MSVFVANEQELPVDEVRIASIARHTLRSEEVQAEMELSVLLVAPEHIRTLNSRFAGHDYATDVLAFPMMEDEEEFGPMLGDVVICPEIARANAGKYGNAFRQELDTLVVHGTLHLLGYNHQVKEEKARMDARMRELLTSFDTARDG